MWCKTDVSFDLKDTMGIHKCFMFLSKLRDGYLRAITAEFASCEFKRTVQEASNLRWRAPRRPKPLPGPPEPRKKGKKRIRLDEEEEESEGESEGGVPGMNVDGMDDFDEEDEASWNKVKMLWKQEDTGYPGQIYAADKDREDVSVRSQDKVLSWMSDPVTRFTVVSSPEPPA